MFRRKPHRWVHHITPELRDHFEQIGVDLVTLDVSNHRYTNQEKQWAAIAWLHEKNNRPDWWNRIGFWATVGGFLLSFLGIALSVGWIKF